MAHDHEDHEIEIPAGFVCLSHVDGPRDGAKLAMSEDVIAEWPEGEIRTLICPGGPCPRCSFPGIESYRREGDKLYHVETIQHLTVVGGPMDGDIQQPLPEGYKYFFASHPRIKKTAWYALEGNELRFKAIVEPSDLPPDAHAEWLRTEGA